ncbi:FkbM family methyltransferase [Sphingomonas sp.]|uniref:FkbM family methyltransferase n=1 Tax=Sphingomonas sp. TaxID=28214 RepID=UPI0038A3C8FA
MRLWDRPGQGSSERGRPLEQPKLLPRHGRRVPLTELIYDIGMHDGEDSEFYLRKGFRVVAVEADPEICRTTAERLRTFLDSGQLTIVKRAIAPARGPLTFYRSETSGWGSVVSKWAYDNAALGVASEPITVDGITLADLVGEYGNAFYMKVDIEGMDRRALESLAATSVRPKYVSMETSFARDPSFDAVRADFEVLTSLGYDRFKIINQTQVEDQLPPQPALAGSYVPIRFTSGASGLFGEESPGPWLTRESALAQFARFVRWKWLEVRLYRNMRYYLLYCKIMFRLTGRYSNLGWYDIHAKHSSVD